MNILFSRMISLKTKIKIMQVIFLFQKNHFEGKIYLPKAIKMRRRRRKIEKNNTPRARYVRLKELLSQGIIIHFPLNYIYLIRT